jgi:hypothetical protein
VRHVPNYGQGQWGRSLSKRLSGQDHLRGDLTMLKTLKGVDEIKDAVIEIKK